MNDSPGKKAYSHLNSAHSRALFPSLGPFLFVLCCHSSGKPGDRVTVISALCLYFLNMCLMCSNLQLCMPKPYLLSPSPPSKYILPNVSALVLPLLTGVPKPLIISIAPSPICRSQLIRFRTSLTFIPSPPLEPSYPLLLPSSWLQPLLRWSTQGQLVPFLRSRSHSVAVIPLFFFK